MNPLDLLSFGTKILDKVIPDKDAREKAQAEMSRAILAGEIDLAKGQLEVNAKEAENPNVFVSGWRPYIGWTCGFAFTYAFCLLPILKWVALIYAWPIPPDLDTEQIMGLLFGMLGLGGMRSWEKAKGVARK